MLASRGRCKKHKAAKKLDSLHHNVRIVLSQKCGAVTLASCGHSQRLLPAGLHPHLDQKRGRSNQEERIERRVDDLVQPQQHLDKRY